MVKVFIKLTSFELYSSCQESKAIPMFVNHFFGIYVQLY